MSTISNLQSQTTVKLTPQGGGDKVDASELRAIIGLVQALLVERGVIKLADITALSATPSTESTFAYVEAQGFFEYQSSGSPDGVDSFSAPNGGIWVRKVVGGSGNLDADLVAIAALTPTNNDIIQRKAGAWINRTMAQLKADLTLAKGDVGLGSVDNTSDAGKPVSTAQASAIALKADKSTTINGHDLSTNVVVTKGDVGLGSVDNTSDSGKPVSTAQAAALALKAPLDSPAFTGIPVAPTLVTSDSSTKLATTAFVQALFASVALYLDNNDFGGSGTSLSPMVANISNILDKLGVARGSVLYRGASGWSILTPGTVGQILTSQGTTADPHWADNGGGGGGGSSDYTKLTSGSLSIVATGHQDFDISSYIGTYKTIVLRLLDIQAAANDDELYLNVSADGTTFDSGSNAYKYTNAGNGDTDVQLTDVKLLKNFNNTSGKKTSIEITLHNPNSSTKMPTMTWEGVHITSANSVQVVRGSAFRQNAQATHAIRLHSNGGDLAGLYEIIGK